MAKQEANQQPTEINELRELVHTFLKRYSNLENEISLLKEDQKNLVDEYKDRLDMKTLKAAMRTVKIKKKVGHADTYETFVDLVDEVEDAL